MKNKTSRTGRNDLCPCGSGLKYKKCCLGKSAPDQGDLAEMYASKYNVRLKQAQDIEAIHQAGQLVVKTLDLVEDMLRPGITTNDINALVHDFTIQNKATPAETLAVQGPNYRLYALRIRAQSEDEIHPLCYDVRKTFGFEVEE